jgi:Short C-terminal domain
VLWRTTLVVLSLAGIACALTVVYLAMRAVMDVGGFCASGGPYVIRQQCPQGVPALMIGGIWGGLICAGIYAWQTIRHRIPNFVGLLWPALFLSLGWNFLWYAFNAPGAGVVWGWLVCGVVFMLMGGLPLVAMLPATVRAFTRGDEHPPGWPAGMPLEHMQRAAARVQPSAKDAPLVDELERLAQLHREGAIDDAEYEEAKRRLLGRDRW